ncbi:ATP-binding protein [Planktotalea sp.]|uniref:ATP-binding protein n=1 Tax=Planktotalea sp. TaxID=2029877 RepID=UPI0032981F58
MAERQSTPRQANKANDIALVFPATESAVRRALNSVCGTLRALAVNDFTLASVEIVLAEVANNIVEHAYANTGNGTISLKCQLEAQLILFEVIDHGATLPNASLPPKQVHDLESDINDLPEGGFGWGIIRDMTHSLAYRRYKGRNILKFSIVCEG